MNLELDCFSFWHVIWTCIHGLDAQELLDILIEIFGHVVLMYTLLRDLSLLLLRQLNLQQEENSSGDNGKLFYQSQFILVELYTGAFDVVSDFVNDKHILVNSDFEKLLPLLRNARDFFKSAESSSVVNSTIANSFRQIRLLPHHSKRRSSSCCRLPNKLNINLSTILRFGIQMKWKQRFVSIRLSQTQETRRDTEIDITRESSVTPYSWI